MLRALPLTILLIPSLSLAFNLKTDPTGSTVKHASKKIVFRMPATVPGNLDAQAVKQAIAQSLSNWAQPSGLDLQAVDGDFAAVPGYQSGAENHNEILFIQSNWTWDENAVAVTLLTMDQTNHVILDADIMFNATTHHFAILPDNSQPGGLYDDVQNSLMHELGHALGLAHSDDSGAVMYPATSRGDISKRTLSADDVLAITTLYPPDSSSADAGQADASEAQALQNVAKNMAAVGCSVSAQGAPAVVAIIFLALAWLWRPVRVRQPVKAKTLPPRRRR